MEKSTAPKGKNFARPAAYVAVVGISTHDHTFEPEDIVTGLSDDIRRLYLKRGYIKKGK